MTLLTIFALFYPPKVPFSLDIKFVLVLIQSLSQFQFVLFCLSSSDTLFDDSLLALPILGEEGKGRTKVKLLGFLKSKPAWYQQSQERETQDYCVLDDKDSEGVTSY